jgi:hypothetical protein
MADIIDGRTFLALGPDLIGFNSNFTRGGGSTRPAFRFGLLGLGSINGARGIGRAEGHVIAGASSTCMAPYSLRRAKCRFSNTGTGGGENFLHRGVAYAREQG